MDIKVNFGNSLDVFKYLPKELIQLATVLKDVLHDNQSEVSNLLVSTNQLIKYINTILVTCNRFKVLIISIMLIILFLVFGFLFVEVCKLFRCCYNGCRPCKSYNSRQGADYEQIS
jgi:hypothetical protein